MFPAALNILIIKLFAAGPSETPGITPPLFIFSPKKITVKNVRIPPSRLKKDVFKTVCHLYEKYA